MLAKSKKPWTPGSIYAFKPCGGEYALSKRIYGLKAFIFLDSGFD